MTENKPDIHDKIEMVPIAEIHPFHGNAKKHKKRDIEALAQHIREYGWDQPIVVVGESGEIIKGHKRRAVAELLGMNEAPVVRLFGLSEVQVEEMRLGDNKFNESKWDMDKLKERIAYLTEQGRYVQKIGFEDLARNIRNKPTRPEVQFAEVMGESSNYIVLTFDNEIDWLAAKTHFGLKTVASRRANGKPWSQGIGRVIDGAAYLRKLKDESYE